MAIRIEALSNGFIMIENYKIINLKQVHVIDPQIEELENGTFYPVYFCFESQIKQQSDAYTTSYYCDTEEDQNFLVQALWQILRTWSNAEPLVFERRVHPAMGKA